MNQARKPWRHRHASVAVVEPLSWLVCLLFATTAHGTAFVDADRDHDTDLADCQRLQTCLTGQDVGLTDLCCEPFDIDGDNDIDLDDLPGLLESLEGPAVHHDPVYILEGVNFSAFVGDQNPNQGDHVSEAQVRERLTIIAPYTKRIRTFGTTNGHQYVCPAARELGLEVAAGAWIGTNLSVNDAEIAGLIAMGQDGCVDIAIVGSEALLRGDVTETQLIEYIEQVKQALPGIPVTTADAQHILLAHPAVLEACDLIMVNYYPYWEGVGVDYAVAVTHLKHQEILAAAGGKDVLVSEAGWPSCGDTIRDAFASPENFEFHLLNFVSWARAEEVEYFYFAAFDEPWKEHYEGPQGRCWGLMGECGQLKPWTRDVLAGVQLPDNWSGTEIVGGPGTPIIEFTYVPPYGTTNEDLRGQVWHVAPADYRVAVYIKVGSGWWTKPYWAQPLTYIRPSGSFVCDIVTGGIDQNATRIKAYLVPQGYDPPLMGGGSTLPAELEENAVAWVEAIRTP